MTSEVWYHTYVAFLTLPKPYKLPRPIPEKMKAYLRGTFRVYWGWASVIISTIFCLLATTYMYSTFSSPLPFSWKTLVHKCGTISVITSLIYLLWTINYYARTRLHLVPDLEYILKIE